MSELSEMIRHTIRRGPISWAAACLHWAAPLSFAPPAALRRLTVKHLSSNYSFLKRMILSLFVERIIRSFFVPQYRIPPSPLSMFHVPTFQRSNVKRPHKPQTILKYIHPIYKEAHA